MTKKKRKKILTISIIIVILIIIIILKSKAKILYCMMSFRTEEEATLCKKTVRETGYPYSVDCMPPYDDLCNRAREAGYPYISH